MFKPTETFKLSRLGIELFTQCPRCFYLSYRFGLRRPRTPPFKLNLLIDTLLKKEFDLYRAQGTPHPFMERFGIAGVPFQHPFLFTWRDNLQGLSFMHAPTNLRITGAVDDIWNIGSALSVIDFKASHYPENPSLRLDRYGRQYQRQLEIYTYSLRRQALEGFTVSNTAYILYFNALNPDRFDNRLQFEPTLVRHLCASGWIEPTSYEIKNCLLAEAVPESNQDCEFCSYRHGGLYMLTC